MGAGGESTVQSPFTASGMRKTGQHLGMGLRILYKDRISADGQIYRKFGPYTLERCEMHTSKGLRPDSKDKWDEWGEN
jgi:hypothetical protein